MPKGVFPVKEYEVFLKGNISYRETIQFIESESTRDYSSVVLRDRTLNQMKTEDLKNANDIKKTEEYDICAMIICKGKRDDPENEKYQRLQIYFFSKDSPFPDNQNAVTDIEGFGTLFLPNDQYIWYLDLLRNETPVYAIANKTETHENGLVYPGDRRTGDRRT